MDDADPPYRGGATITPAVSTFRTALPGALAKCGRPFGVIIGEINLTRYLEATDHAGPRIVSAINATTLPGFGDGRVHIAQWFFERCRISLNGLLSDKDRLITHPTNMRVRNRNNKKVRRELEIPCLTISCRKSRGV